MLEEIQRQPSLSVLETQRRVGFANRGFPMFVKLEFGVKPSSFLPQRKDFLWRPSQVPGRRNEEGRWRGRLDSVSHLKL